MSGALELALDEARARVADALSCLECLPPGPDRESLAVLGTYLVERAT